MAEFKSLVDALADLQRNLPVIGKQSKGQYGTYSNLADVSKVVLPMLGERGLAWACMPTLPMTLPDDAAEVPGDTRVGSGPFVLHYVLKHHPSGQCITGSYPLPQGTPQAVGSAITYARRYALCAVTGVVADEDDDGQAAEASARRPAPVRKPRPQQPPRPLEELPRNQDGTVSRSQSTDEELAATGQMTSQQMREHNRMVRDVQETPRKAERATAADDDDPWYDSPPQPLRKPQAARDPVRDMATHFARLGVTDRDERLSMTGMLARRDGPITSSKELTAAQGLQVLRVLSACKDRQALEEALMISMRRGPK